jgi:virulence-associated protein VapD
MRIVAHTKYGVFEGVENEYDEEKYADIGKFLENIHKLEYFSFTTDKGEIYITKEMIADTLFILEK